MTINQLRQYRKLKERLLLLIAERNELILRSTVGDGTPSRSGVPSNTVAHAAEEREKKQKDIDTLEERLQAVERYVSECEEYYGTMLKMHYIEGKTWTAIALRMGGKNTKESVRKACHRYIEKN